jgi:hypothetical protein
MGSIIGELLKNLFSKALPMLIAGLRGERRILYSRPQPCLLEDLRVRSREIQLVLNPGGYLFMVTRKTMRIFGVYLLVSAAISLALLCVGVWLYGGLSEMPPATLVILGTYIVAGVVFGIKDLKY